jgi:hypothetical protein
LRFARANDPRSAVTTETTSVTVRLLAIAAAAERIKAKSFTIDGEAVVLGRDFVDDDNVPNLDDPKVQPTITADNLVASRADGATFMMKESKPGNAMDLRVAALLARHAVKIWVFTSVSLVA